MLRLIYKEKFSVHVTKCMGSLRGERKQHWKALVHKSKYKLRSEEAATKVTCVYVADPAGRLVIVE